MLRVHIECGRHPAALRQWFPAPEPDAFFDECVLTGIYGDRWLSIVIEEDGHALRHAFAASAIGATGLLDIEPLMGYAGPLATADAPADFLIAALRRYSAVCRDNGIVAELVRFNPILQNQRALDRLIPELLFSPPKPIVYLPVQDEEPERMSNYPRSTRNMVRAGYRSAKVLTLEKTPDTWSQLRELYDRTLGATGAASHWQLAPDLWERLRQHERFALFGAVQAERLVSGAIALVDNQTWYYFLAAGVREPETRRGTSNAVVHEISVAAGRAGATRVGLGGGRTGAMTDSLFAFKHSFGGDVLPFAVGLFTHDRPELDSLVHAAERSDPSVADSPLFLRYRLTPVFSPGRMSPVPIWALAGPAA